MALKEHPFSEKLILILILIIAVFFRFWKIESIPPGLYPDEALNANEAWNSLKTGTFQVFYPENNGREGLFFWLTALSFYIFDPSIWSFKIVSAVFGLLTVWGLYLLSQELITILSQDKKKAKAIALLSSLFLAVSFWHVNFSRIGFRAILFPFVLVFSFFFLFRALRKLFSNEKQGQLLDWLFSGLFFGLGFYTYTSFRMSVIIIGILLFFSWILSIRQGLQKEFLKSASLYLLVILILALPLGIYFLKNPQYFVSRASQVLVFSQPNPIKSTAESLVLHLAMFNFHGDQNWRHNLPSSPQLFWPIGIFFLIGSFFYLKELFSSLRKKDFLSSIFNLTIWAWLAATLLPGILTCEGLPHALRTIGAIPVVYILAAMGCWQIMQFLWEKLNNKNLMASIIVISFLILVFFQFNKYFIVWGQNPETENAFAKDYVEIGQYLNSLPENTQKIVIVNRSGVPVPWPDGLPMPAQTVMFMENSRFGKIQSSYLLPKDINNIKIKPGTVIVLMGSDSDLFQKTKTMFPQLKVIEENKILTY